MLEVMVVFGTRPEAIKLAPIVEQLRSRSAEFSTRVCVTGQHRQMLDHVLQLFQLAVDDDLDLMQPGQSLPDLTSRVLTALSQVFAKEKPDFVVVQGDTTTTFAASLAAYYQRILVAHVEAGLRTYDKYQPFPEEINRRLTGHIADLHFAPTALSREHLLQENIAPSQIFVTGNTVVDALLRVVQQQHSPQVAGGLERSFAARGIDLQSRVRRILVTGHRRENFGEPFEQICQALRQIASTFPDVEIIYPVHLNPNVQAPVYRLLGDCKNIKLIPPVDYAEFVFLMQRAHLILTDSGGVQEEAPSLGKPVLVMRGVTERPEGIQAGVVRLAGVRQSSIVEHVTELLTDSKAYAAMATRCNPYGDGRAAERICDILAGRKPGLFTPEQQEPKRHQRGRSGTTVGALR